MKLMGNQLLYSHSFFLLDPKLNQIHMQWKAAEKKLWSFDYRLSKYYISKFNSTILKNYGLLLNITETLPNRHCIETSPQYNDHLGFTGSTSHSTSASLWRSNGGDGYCGLWSQDASVHSLAPWLSGWVGRPSSLGLNKDNNHLRTKLQVKHMALCLEHRNAQHMVDFI